MNVNLNIKKKLLIMFIALLIASGTVLSVFGYFNSKSGSDELIEVGLKNSVLLASELINAHQKLVDANVLTLEEAQEEVKRQLIGDKIDDQTRDLQVDFEFGDNGYFVVFDKEGNTIAHPTIEGVNVWDEQFKGTFFIQEMIKQAENGGGFTYYDFPMPNDPDTVKQKVSYSQISPHWDWIIGVNAYTHEYNSHTNRFLINSAITLIITVAVGMFFGNFFANYISKPINEIMHHAEAIANGDLTSDHISFKEKDELGILATSINKMTDNLRTVIRQMINVTQSLNSHSKEMGQASNEVMEGSEQIAATMEQLSAAIESEANYISDLSHTMDTYSSKVSEANENGRNVQQSSREVLEMTTDGYELMEKSTEQMNIINEIVRDSVDKIKHLDGQSKQISELVSVIQDIAEQTNLLALNASIEAARAGEHGHGFAVVANEVRKLAEEVSESVTNITDIVTRIQRETNIVTESLQDGYKEVEQGTEQITETGETFSEISTAVENMVNHIQIVTDNLSDIAGEGTEMNNTVQEIASISEQSAAGIEETTASAEQSSRAIEEINHSSNELIQIANELNELVRQFKL